VAKELNKAAYEGAFDRLVLVVPSRFLGELRDALDRHTRERVIAELSKDLTHLPTHELKSHLDDTIRL
jgi:protein required for attachment to host cells